MLRGYEEPRPPQEDWLRRHPRAFAVACGTTSFTTLPPQTWHGDGVGWSMRPYWLCGGDAGSAFTH
jgi:hypothetical protein